MSSTPRRNLDFSALEQIIRRDPAARGVASFQPGGQFLAPGQLARAAESLAARGGTVAVITGFCIASDPPAAETDGPPGALFIARALAALGREVVLISDRYGVPLLECGRQLWQLNEVTIEEFPFDGGDPHDAAHESNAAEHCRRSDTWIEQFLDLPLGRRLTHLVAVERVGPSHTLESIGGQPRRRAAPLAEFDAHVPPADRDVCHDMHGNPIGRYTAKLHRLFEAVAALRNDVETIGVADGGNEIGMGQVPWELVRAAVRRGPGGRIACRIATDHLLLAGVSNWAAYALAAAAAALEHRTDLVADWTVASQRQLIEVLAREAAARDGVTRLSQPTVDGLSLDVYGDVLETVRRVCLGEQTR